jgi:hypothetical protein
MTYSLFLQPRRGVAAASALTLCAALLAFFLFAALLLGTGTAPSDAPLISLSSTLPNGHVYVDHHLLDHADADDFQSVPSGFVLVDEFEGSGDHFEDVILAWLERIETTPHTVLGMLIFNTVLLLAQINMMTVAIRRQKALVHALLVAAHAGALVAWTFAAVEWPRVLGLALAPWLQQLWESCVIHCHALVTVLVYSLLFWAFSLHVVTDALGAEFGVTFFDDPRPSLAAGQPASFAIIFEYARLLRALKATCTSRTAWPLASALLVLTGASLASALPVQGTVGLLVRVAAIPLVVFALSQLTRIYLAMERAWLDLAWSANDLLFVRVLARVVRASLLLHVCFQACSMGMAWYPSSAWLHESLTCGWWSPVALLSTSVLSFLTSVLRHMCSPVSGMLIDVCVRMAFTICSASNLFLSLDGLHLREIQRRLALMTKHLAVPLSASAPALADPSASASASAASLGGSAEFSMDGPTLHSSSASSPALPKGTAPVPPSPSVKMPVVPTPIDVAAASSPASVLKSVREVNSFVRDFLSEAAAQNKKGLSAAAAAKMVPKSAESDEQLRQRKFLKSVTHCFRTPLQSGTLSCLIINPSVVLKHAVFTSFILCLSLSLWHSYRYEPNFARVWRHLRDIARLFALHGARARCRNVISCIKVAAAHLVAYTERGRSSSRVAGVRPKLARHARQCDWLLRPVCERF